MLPVVDIFAGPGGLGEGFTQAGFKVLVSAEMNPTACETLTLRKFFHCFPKGEAPEEYYRFIKGQCSVENLREAYPREWKVAIDAVANVELGSAVGNQKLYEKLDQQLCENQNFVLIGGPPCQAYSLAGRSRMLGIGQSLNSSAEDDVASIRAELAAQFYADGRHTLYLEYLKILCRYQPAVFILENVKGMGSAKASADAEQGSVFSNICHGLRNPHDATGMLTSSKQVPIGYRLYGLSTFNNGLVNPNEVQSARECILKSEEYGVPQARHRIIIVGVRADISNRPAPLKPTISEQTVRDAIGDMPHLRSGLSKIEDTHENWVQAISTQAQDFLIGKTNIDSCLQTALETLRGENKTLNRGAPFIKTTQEQRNSVNEILLNELLDPRLGGVLQHQTRGHMKSDLIRYFLVSVLGAYLNRSPTLADWQGQLEAIKPNHKNVSASSSSLETKAHKDRFKVQVWNRPSSTVVSHISKDGHYFIHPDPSQCRSLTVREAARLQTFPDNYFFCGNRTQQFHQVGNAVPVLLAKQIAKTILEMKISSHI